MERSIVLSALWAAAGDSIGWITELARDSHLISYRTGGSSVTEPVAWQRNIGGRNGPRVDLPAGTYSDDTQLRLAVCRSIRGNGSFDAETFAKIELTVWPTYALGGGLGTKAAALNLSKRGVNWFSNFFASGEQKYVYGGGNGAAMRVQPHVWASRQKANRLYTNVLKDALITHGHPHGFCGAFFHAMALADALASNEIPPPAAWKIYVERFTDISDLVSSEPQLAAFWLAPWEKLNGESLPHALERTKTEALSDIEKISGLLQTGGVHAYRLILEELGCFSPRFRGSGLKTAIAALALAFLFKNSNPSEALVVAANELESDTDTIATMAGALLGTVALEAPGWHIQDRDYLIREARRLFEISDGNRSESFNYPSLSQWNPPTKQTDAVSLFENGFAIAGLGVLKSVSREYSAGDATWQWFELPFGQTILAKRKAKLKDAIALSQLPGMPRKMNVETPNTRISRSGGNAAQSDLPLGDISGNLRTAPSDARKSVAPALNQDYLDSLSDEIIRSGFDDLTLGRLLNRYIDRTHSVDLAVALTAIVAKAKLARSRRSSSS